MDDQPANMTPQATPNVRFVTGDLLAQSVDVIVNAWNRNVIPWWLLLPQGVSGSIKRQAGSLPFRELARSGWIPLGHTVMTGAGRLSYEAIVHVAGINLLWRASEYSIRESVRSAIRLAESQGFKSIAFPAIGAGSGGFDVNRSLELIADELARIRPSIQVIVVRYKESTP